MENETIPNDSEVSTSPETTEPVTEPTGTTGTETIEPTVEENQLEVLLHIDARLERLEGIQTDNLTYLVEFHVVEIALVMGVMAFYLILRSWISSLR